MNLLVADGAPEAASLIEQCAGAFDLVSAFVMVAVAFFVVVKIVGWINRMYRP